ncbi:UNVERIFIED_CONTAM: hypothetical protein FKN15_018911 [Acipenser sinensis]
MVKNWGVIGGVAAAVAAGVYVLWGPVTERKKRKKGMVPGLLNLGNTCFMNSLLQGLAACPSFIRWLEEFTGGYNQDQNQQQQHPQLARTLLQLLKALSMQELAEGDVLDTGKLLEVLRMYRWQISSFEEQDAHELFHVLTSSLEEEERDRHPRITHLFDVQSLERAAGMDEKNLSCRSRGPLHPLPNSWQSQHPFHGRLTSNMVCKRCDQQSPVRYDSFDSLSLTIPTTTWACICRTVLTVSLTHGRPVTLDHCLQHFISSETIKDVECENCTKIHAGGVLNGQVVESQRTTFIKQLKLGKLPQCLCIHLQRLTWSSQGTPIKRQEHVHFTEFLSMDSYKHRTAGQSSSAYLFRLSAVLVHHGDMHSGHFVTYRRSPPSPKNPSAFSSQWLWVSDDSVRKASLQEALSSNAYLLFYERVRPAPSLLRPSPRLTPEE